MLVTPDTQQGTIGGGNLEFSAVRVARDRHLANTILPHRQKFALGPALGQCCGGSVELLFETIDMNTPITDTAQGWYCRRIDQSASKPARLARAPEYPEKLLLELGQAPANECFTIAEHEGETWACDKLASADPVVFLFGAGHVGEALIAQLTLLACDIIWVDERAEIFPAILPRRVSAVLTDCPADEVTNAADDAWFIVMTHSHSTDFDICRSVLEKKRFSFLGLIGSQTKRTTFRRRLAYRGVEPVWVDRLCCPIGIEGIRSNFPEAIAVGVAAQLLMLWESENYKQT